MKIGLYFESEKLLQTSGIGRAMKHQMMALESAGIDYTTDMDQSFDILHISTYGPSSIFVIDKARKQGAKIVYHAHSTEEDFRNSFVLSNQIAPYLKKHLVNMYSLGDIIVTPTPYAKRLLEGYGIVKPIQAISNGIQLKKYNKDPEKERAFRSYFNLKEEDKVVMGVGLYFKRKGIHDFMEVAKHFPDTKFIWFGFTPLISIPKGTRQVIEDHPPNVILPGYVKGPIIEGAYTSADCFFFPSYEETEGIVVLEALASQCPTVIRDIPVYEDWLINGESCFKAQDNAGFVKVIHSILEGTAKDTREGGYRIAAERDIQEVGKALKAVYEKVVEI